VDLPVLREVFNGVRRFDDMQRRTGAPRQVLSDRLARLVERGLLRKVPYRERGQRSRQEYRLTEAGLDLYPVLVALMQWGDAACGRPGGPPALLTASRTAASPSGSSSPARPGHRLGVGARGDAAARPGRAQDRLTGRRPGCPIGWGAMSFDVSADAYTRFMGAATRSRWRRGSPIWPGCGAGSGRWTSAAGLARSRRSWRAGWGAGQGLRGRSLGVVRGGGGGAAARGGGQRGGGRTAPVPGGAFDAVLAQLVVHFMTDPVAGLREMGRVTRRGGVVGACVGIMAAAAAR
jgi:DNA-binding HxlR family transcriptional regulator